MKALFSIILTLVSISGFSQFGEGGFAYQSSSQSAGDTAGLNASQVLNLIDGAMDEKQDVLVSGTNIKTINNQPITGPGNIVVSADAPDSAQVVQIVQTATQNMLDTAQIGVCYSDVISPFYTFGIGLGRASDTALFESGAYCGGFRTGVDTVVITSLIGWIQTGSGTSSVAVQVNWDPNANDGTPTKLNTADFTVTSTTTGNVDTSFANFKIPPNSFVWGTISGVNTGSLPKQLTFQIDAYKIPVP